MPSANIITTRGDVDPGIRTMYPYLPESDLRKEQAQIDLMVIKVCRCLARSGTDLSLLDTFTEFPLSHSERAGLRGVLAIVGKF
jgi:hypothetical protein